jgi:hypothetical protein
MLGRVASRSSSSSRLRYRSRGISRRFARPAATFLSTQPRTRACPSRQAVWHRRTLGELERAVGRVDSHARLAVHAAHTMAVFVLETWGHGKSVPSDDRPSGNDGDQARTGEDPEHSVVRQQMIEQLMRETMNYDAEFRQQDAMGDAPTHGISACTRAIRASFSQNRTKCDPSQLLKLSKLASTQSLAPSARRNKRERRLSLLLLSRPAERAVLNKTFARTK